METEMRKGFVAEFATETTGTETSNNNENEGEKKMGKETVEEGTVEEGTVEEEMVMCVICGEMVKKSEAQELEDGVYACKKCDEDGVMKCPDCGKWIRDEDSYCIDNGDSYVCEDCLGSYYRCDECGNYFTESNVHMDDRGDIVICNYCYDEYGYHTCTDCDAPIRDSDTYWYDDDPYCSDCYDSNNFDSEENSDGNLQDYSYKPSPIFYGDNLPNVPHYGVELEIDHGNDESDTIRELAQNKHVYMKHDGSLDEGIEIVSHPCTLDYHLNSLGWDELCNIAIKNRWTSHNAKTCGLHVHIERKKISEDTPEKLVVLSDAIWSKLAVFSRRRNSQLGHWCKKCDSDVLESDTEVAAKRKAAEKVRYDRYFAVNLQNSNTVEIRIFRGTLNINTLKATLQFVDNMVKYCESHTFVEIVHAKLLDVANVNMTNALRIYLGQRELLEPEKEVKKTAPRELKIGDRVWTKIFKSGDTDEPSSYLRGSVIQIGSANTDRTGLLESSVNSVWVRFDRSFGGNDGMGYILDENGGRITRGHGFCLNKEDLIYTRTNEPVVKPKSENGVEPIPEIEDKIDFDANVENSVQNS